MWGVFFASLVAVVSGQSSQTFSEHAKEVIAKMKVCVGHMALFRGIVFMFSSAQLFFWAPTDAATSLCD